MFKNKAIYIEAVEKKTVHPHVVMTPPKPDRQLEDIIEEVISHSGPEVVRGIVIMMGAYFAFKTISVVLDNLTHPDRKE